MHPILHNRRWLGLYAVAWAPLVVLCGYLLRATGLAAGETIALLLPLMPLYALLCLGAWYPCRATPIPQTDFARLVTTHLAAAAIISGFWMLLAIVYAAVLEQVFLGVSAYSHRPARLQGLAQHPGLFKTIFAVGVLIYLLSVALQYVLQAMEKSRQAEQREAEARLLARDAELRALKAQINPHFLFNSLHSISALTSLDPAKAQEMCIILGDFLRKTLGLSAQELIPLAEELSLLRSYLAIEQIRFGERLKVEERVATEALQYLVPPLLLQPLVENAIRHGVANLQEGGFLDIDARADQGQLHLSIANNFDPEYRPVRGGGIGLVNVRERLQSRYGKDALFDAGISGTCYLVRLTLPAELPQS